MLEIALILALSNIQTPRPVNKESAHVTVIDLKTLVPRPVVPVKKQVSRSRPVVERRVMTVTAYTKDDPGMDGRGITTSEEPVQEGRTIAADPSIPFGTQIFIPKLGRTYVVTDRGSAIHGNKLDLYVEKREDALAFGVQRLEVFIKY